MSSKLKRIVEEARENNLTELDVVEKGVVNVLDVPGILSLQRLTRITFSHNKIVVLPPGIVELVNLDVLNLFNNHIEELPTNISDMPKLRILIVGMNRLYNLPRGFGNFKNLEVLDLTYNNLSEKSLPGNFFMLTTLRALYLGDNDFEYLPREIGKLKNLEILVLRDNDLVAIPPEIGDLTRLKELHLQNNRLTVLPPEMAHFMDLGLMAFEHLAILPHELSGNLDMVGTKQVFRYDNNPWVNPIQEHLQAGLSQLFEYLRSDTYKFLYNRHVQTETTPPPKTSDKSKKVSRKR